MFSPRRSYLSGLFAEFGRATAAAQRYDDLRYRSASHGKIAPANIPQQIFEEFYSLEEAVESRRAARPRSDSSQPRGSAAKALS